MYPHRVAFLLLSIAIALFAMVPELHAEATATTSNDGSVELSTEAAPVKPEAPGSQTGIDPARVGLAGLGVPLVTAEDFERASALIDARIADIEKAGQGDVSVAEGEAVAPDPRIAPLQALRLEVQRRAALVGRLQEAQDALTDLQAESRTLKQAGLAIKPPYGITRLDQFRSEQRSGKQDVEAAERALAMAQQQIAAADEKVAQANERRRRLRDQVEQAEAGADSGVLARRLEAVRLSVLAAHFRQEAARTELELAQRQDDLARQRLSLLASKVERVKADLVFTQAALDEQLKALDGREKNARERITVLEEASNAAEGALFEARRRLRRTTAEQDNPLLQERVAAREAELAAARKGVEYLSQIVTDIASARTLWQRRYALMQDDAPAAPASWLSDTDAILDAITEETQYIQARMASLRSIQLTLAQRLGESRLDPEMRTAIQQRQTALDQQEGLAEALLAFEDQLRALAQQFRAELTAAARAHTFAQRLDALVAHLRGWWNQELFVFQDQGFYLRDIVTGGLVFVLVLAIVSFFKTLLRRSVLPRLTSAARGDGRAPRALVLAFIRNTSQIFVMAVAFYAAMAASGLAQGPLEGWLWSVLVVVVWLQVGLWASAGAVDLIQRQRSHRERIDPSAVTGFGLMLFFARVGIWMLVLVSVLSHFDYPITGLIGALGVGGIAIAFAVQNILADVFSSMAIILDKPFRVGDFIVTGNTLGVIEQIGVKTTQIRSLSGEQVIMSNTELLNSRIHNFKRMRERRVVFKLGVVYQTPPETLERIPAMIEEIVRGQARARFDRAHFFEYADFALMFEVVYYVQGADYTLYMDIQQAINLAIYRAFREAGVAFAYPTQELILRRGQGMAKAAFDDGR
ncbi:mechanosensitive ion channel domain-containing protein [Thiocystis violacea]|uniref:mechanosensitive ion channel domain-containing protein n=1 Tax=Thiocystis violacea TaxID=13725 RepID=UPI001905B259|nr:mechanosensitive ion channel domain-containing protein [Thiocystis violacea]